MIEKYKLKFEGIDSTSITDIDREEYNDYLYAKKEYAAEKEKAEKMIPFNELSKSGKIVNVYNAVLMAEDLIKQKD